MRAPIAQLSEILSVPQPGGRCGAKGEQLATGGFGSGARHLSVVEVG
jgi:hypothetical protein